MAREIDIVGANSVLRKFRSRLGKRRQRIHIDTAMNNVNKQRALDGLCGDCKNLKILIWGKGQSEGIQLICKKGRSPVYLYSEVPLGEEANCPDFNEKPSSPRARKHTSETHKY